MTLEEFLSEWHNTDATVLVHTSGSTGRPKPLRVEKARMAASARITCSHLKLSRGDTALLCMPLDYIAGKMMVVRSLEWGLRLLSVPPSGHPLKGLSEAPVFAAMVPLQVYNSLRVPEERALLCQIRHLLIGGGAVNATLEREIAQLPGCVWSTYGMTETLSHVALRKLNGPERSEWYEPLEGVRVEVNEEGCLVIEAPAVCPERLVTRDVAQLHADGRRFRIRGRSDNVVVSGGLKIQIEEVEDRLRPYLSVPFMLSKCEDQALGEALVLLVEPCSSADVMDTCRRVLPRYEVPRRVLTIGHLPTTETGKPNRAEALRLAAGVATGSEA